MRGGLVYAERLRAGRPEVKGIVSATRGNHGQSLAFAGRAAGIGVTIVVPEGNSPDKNADTGQLLQVLAGQTPGRLSPGPGQSRGDRRTAIPSVGAGLTGTRRPSAREL